MKAILAHILRIALFVSYSTVSVHAFQPNPYPVGTTTRVTSGYGRLPKTVNTYGIHEGKTISGDQALRLFSGKSFHQSLKQKQGRIRRLLQRFSTFFRLSKRLSCRLRAFVAAAALFMMINLSVLPAWAAPSNGRAAGSFGRSNKFQSRPSISRNIRKPQINGGIRAAPTRIIYSPRPRMLNRNPSYLNFHQANGEAVEGEGVAIMTGADGTTNYVRKVNTHPYSNSRFSASDIVLVSGVTAVVTNGVMKRRSDRNKYDHDDLSRYPLGPGISVWRMTACLNVPNINDPTSIVRRLQRLAETTSTETRKGLQTILAETSLELLRQLEKGSVSSVESRFHHYRSSDQALVRAERQYNRISTRERSKFEKESWSSYNGNVVRDNTKEDDDLSQASATEGTSSVALVQIHLVIEGDAMKPFGQRQMETRRSFQEALVQLSGDLTAVEDCVLAGEVLWAPQQFDQGQLMTEEDVYASHPTLWPVDYSIKADY